MWSNFEFLWLKIINFLADHHLWTFQNIIMLRGTSKQYVTHKIDKFCLFTFLNHGVLSLLSEKFYNPNFGAFGILPSQYFVAVPWLLHVPLPTREPSRQVRSSCITFFQPFEKLFRVFFADLTQLRFVDLCGSEGEGGGLRRGCFGFQRFVVVEYLRVLKYLKNLWGQVDSRCLNFSLDVVFVNFCTKTKNFHFCESSVVGSTESCLPIHGNVPLQASWLWCNRTLHSFAVRSDVTILLRVFIVRRVVIRLKLRRKFHHHESHLKWSEVFDRLGRKNYSLVQNVLSDNLANKSRS